MHDGEGGGDDPDRDDWSSKVPDFVREALLDHELRQAIFDLLGKRPGMNKNQICEELELHPNLLEHHLAKLETGGLVVTRPSAQKREILCFTAEDQDLWENERTRILFGRNRTRQIGLYLAEHPGATSKEISEAMDLSPVTIRYHLRTLRDHSLVRKHPVGRSTLYEPVEALEEWASELGGSFSRPWDA